MTETALITGASSGIGLEPARCFAADGAALVLVARRRDKLEALAARLREMDMIQVNVAALVQLLLPAMKQRGRGGVLNVASTGAFQPGPNLAVYFATKAFVLSFSEALHEELADGGVTVTCLAPGPTATSFAERAKLEKSLLFRFNVQDAASVARAGHRAFRRGKAVIVPALLNKLTVFAVRLGPRALVRKIAGRLPRE